MLSTFYLILSLFGAWLAWNVHRPAYRPANLATASWVAGWLTQELSLHLIAIGALVTLAFAAAGVFDTVPGQIGLWITMASWVALAFATLRSREAGPAVERALREAFGADYGDRIPADVRKRFPVGLDRRGLVRPFPVRHPDVARERDILYRRSRGVNLRLDVYRHRTNPTGCPVLFQIHGGGWVVGSKNEQGLPLMNRMARQGWVCVSADYRLSPHATFPDHLVDLKHALHWVRERIADYGGDPDFVVVSGGSAGGHLAALVALTANDPELQPGFEDVDTSVAACVPFYGVYDFTGRFATWHHDAVKNLLETKVMKASVEEDPEAYRKASPLDRIHAGAPPFFVIHGDLDTLVPVEEARHFVERLRQVSKAPILYAEIPGAQHAFELFTSWRTELVLAGVERFLALVRAGHQSSRQSRDDARAAG